jgi:hypothetical protein
MKGSLDKMKINKMFIITLTAVIGIVLYIQYGGSPNQVKINTVTSGLVTDKANEPYRITFALLDEDEIEYIELFVNNENVWNLIEVNRFYFVTFYKDGDSIYELGQIDNNDDFGVIYESEYYELIQ